MARFLALAALAVLPASSIRPSFSWDFVGNMTFLHACNESGLWSEEALDTIQRFPFVTVEKGQGFNDKSNTSARAEEKIVAQLAAIKKRDPSISTVFYMNSVLSWYFYHMNDIYEKEPSEWLYDSTTHKAVRTSGDKHFDPPKSGMLVFDHAKQEVRDFWKDVCVNATLTGVVDGCFSDSSQPGSHKTAKYLNASDNAAFEAGKVQTMADVTAHFGGKAGAPYGKSTGTLIGKKSNQSGINAYQIEFFSPSEASIMELKAGVDKGYLVQAHVGIDEDVSMGCGCACMNNTLAAFLIGAGENCYYGSGPWISPDLKDIQTRWCPPLFEKPLGAPISDATKDSSGVYHRAFKSGATVEFDTTSNTGKIHWA